MTIKDDKTLTNKEVLEFIQRKLGISKFTDTAKHLGVERQQINQFKNTNAKNLSQRVMTQLITIIEEQDSIINEQDAALSQIAALRARIKSGSI